MAKRQLKEYSNVALRPEDVRGRIDFFNVFGRKDAVHIEIGSGKGFSAGRLSGHRVGE
jgi:tRNA G46 methylase TrmB